MDIYVENINDIIHETSVDFVLRPCAREIHIVQYDKSLPIIKVNLFREGQPYQLPTNASVHVRLGKLDHTFVYANILGMNEDRTIAYFAVSEQMAMIAGRVSPVIEVVYQGKVACSSPIPFVIDRNPVQEGQIESHDEFPVIYQLESDVEDHNDWIRRYTALTEFDGFVEGESVWDDIAEGEIKYCQSGSQTEDIPGENTVIKIDLSQQHLSKAESKALYIKKIIINYTPDGQEEEETYEYTFNSRIFGNGTSSPTIEPSYADLTDDNSGTTLRWYLNYLLAEGVSNYFGNYNGAKGQQFGSNSNPPALISLSTSSLENCTVNSVYVEVSSNSGTQAKCKLTLVNDVWTCNDVPDPEITKDNISYEFLHEPNGTHLGSSSGGQVIHHYNHVFLKKENGRVSEVEPDETLQYILNDYSATYKYSTVDNLLHQIGSSGGGANFEVLSRIEQSYDSEDGITYITFPANIMPEVMYMDSTNLYIFFDYKNHRVLDSSGNEITVEGEFSLNNNVLSIQLDGDYSIDPEYDFIKYGVFDGADNPGRHTNIMLNYYEVYNGSGGGLPEATKAGQVLVSNSDLEFEVQDSVPKAENLTSSPEMNDALYSSGPTGGFSDISTGQEAYLNVIKGYTINWGWFREWSAYQTVTLDPTHIYLTINRSNQTGGEIIQNQTRYSVSNVYCYDLTRMFGGNSRIPFDLASSTTIYPQNGNLPAESYSPRDAFMRLLSSVNVYQGSTSTSNVFKNVKVSKLVEIGRNLWDSSYDDPNSPGLRVLAGYKYEVYLVSNSHTNYIKFKGDYYGAAWINQSISGQSRGDGYYVYYFKCNTNGYIKSYDSSYSIAYVGFVHSGNYCLTSGSTSSQNYPTTAKPIPAFVKNEFTINIASNGLNGIPDNSENHCSVYDTVDMQRVGVIEDLSTLTWADNGDDTYSAQIPGIKPSTTQLLANNYIDTEMTVDSNGVLTISSTSSPTGGLLYELETPIPTGQPAFNPIALKDNQNNWVIDDMGNEYFEGLDVCPVNQVSVYIANLKDKLINLNPITVQKISHVPTLTSLDGIKIGDNSYKVVPCGTAKQSTSLAIGSVNLNNAQQSIGIGSFSTTSSYTITIGNYLCSNDSSYGIVIGTRANVGGGASGGIAIGSHLGNSNWYTTVTGTGSIAIGAIARILGGATDSIVIGRWSSNMISKTFCIDGASETYRRTYQAYSPDYIWFRNADVNDNSFAYNTFESYKSSHFLGEYITNKQLTVGSTGKYYIEYTDSSNYKTITGNCVSGTFESIDKYITGMHITVKVTGTATTPSHAVVGLDLLPYDSTNSHGFISWGRVEVDGTIMDISATIDSDGVVNITAPTGCTIDKVYYNIR